MRARRLSITTLAAALTLGACATTVNDDPQQGATLADETPGTIEAGTIVDDVPATTAPLEGSAADLLPELAVEMSRLGSQVADGGDDDEILARIEAIWTAIRPELESTHPELVNGIGATVDMARSSVERTHPSDADKAFNILTDLVDKFTGDG